MGVGTQVSGVLVEHDQRRTRWTKPRRSSPRRRTAGPGVQLRPAIDDPVRRPVRPQRSAGLDSGNFLVRVRRDLHRRVRRVRGVRLRGPDRRIGGRWVDNDGRSPSTAPHPCTAHAFIDYILDAENGGEFTNYNYYASPNAAAEEFIEAEILEDPAIYPTDLSKLEFITDTGDFEINFSDAFIEAKS